MIKKKLYRMRWKGFQLKKRITDILRDEKGIGVVEVILILVGIFTPYYGVGIWRKNMWINSTINTRKGGKCA